jgi:uncharacterized protein (UPF0332 family)
MTLANLVGRTLEKYQCTPEEVARLLAAARRNLVDAQIKGLSATTRFDVAYKSVVQSALAALMANGYRPLTSVPGHHATVIQSLPQTIGLTNERRILLDKLRRLRNANDYTGEGASEEEAGACLRAATSLVQDVEAWLENNPPHLRNLPE